jgi:hypothetical protein
VAEAQLTVPDIRGHYVARIADGVGSHRIQAGKLDTLVIDTFLIIVEVEKIPGHRKLLALGGSKRTLSRRSQGVPTMHDQ